MSIRTKLFLAISSLVAFFVILSLFLNSQYLGKYYIMQKKASLAETQKKIEEIYKGNPEEISLELESLERNRGINITFLSPDFISKYPTFRGLEIGHIRRIEPSPMIRSIKSILEEIPQGRQTTEMVVDPRLRSQFLVRAARLSNGDYVILSSPIAAINESTAIANRFFLFTGLVTILLGGIAVFLFARQFTRPILELNEIAQRMSKLDFSKKYPIQSNDEVGQLGNSINSLSDQLDKAISELTEANDKLREDIQRERRIDKMRKEFVSNVSHELKTPIALIQGYAEGLKLNINENEEDRDFYCDVIMDETDKMNRLVKDLLDLSQIESGYFKLENSDFDIGSLVDHTIEKFRPILNERNIHLTMEREESVAVRGDQIRIEQVLVNYLNNAINHVDEQKIIRIKVNNRPDKVRVSVYNSGKPIPEEALDKLWTSFYKVDKSRHREYGGTGLGLSVVRAIMELHRNAYGVENRTDGVNFWFEVDRVA